MKKLFTILALFAVVLSLSACTTKVAGKTFVYEELEIKWTDEADDSTKEKVEAAVVLVFGGSKVTFEEDQEGTTWTQDGSTVTVAGVEYTAKGGKLYKEVSIEELEAESTVLKFLGLSKYVTSVKIVYAVAK